MYYILLRGLGTKVSIAKDTEDFHVEIDKEYFCSKKDLKQLAVFLWHVSEGKEFKEAEKLSVEYYEKKLQWNSSL